MRSLATLALIALCLSCSSTPAATPSSTSTQPTTPSVPTAQPYPTRIPTPTPVPISQPAISLTSVEWTIRFVFEAQGFVFEPFVLIPGEGGTSPDGTFTVELTMWDAEKLEVNIIFEPVERLMEKQIGRIAEVVLLMGYEQDVWVWIGKSWIQMAQAMLLSHTPPHLKGRFQTSESRLLVETTVDTSRGLFLVDFELTSK